MDVAATAEGREALDAVDDGPAYAAAAPGTNATGDGAEVGNEGNKFQKAVVAWRSKILPSFCGDCSNASQILTLQTSSQASTPSLPT